MPHPAPSPSPRPSADRPAGRSARRWPRRAALALAAAAALGAPAAALAVDFGPFSLTGFVKAEAQRITNACEDCQREAGENRQRIWADDIAFGKSYGGNTATVTLFQPYLGFNQRVGGGFEVFALLSQRWRDGEVDIEDWLYEANVGVAHEDYGRLTIGAMPTRSWSVADYPYGTFFGIADPWANSGAGYGLLSRALRYMSRPIDVFEGDLRLEATYDMGESGWDRNTPRFLELYAQFVKGDLVIDAIAQAAENGEPVGWGKAPFGGLTPFPEDDPLLGGSSQGIFMLMARYQVDARVELAGGIRFNRWSGAYAVQTTPGDQGRWNSMFNVDWGGFDANGVPNPGYSARSTDLMLGLRYRFDERVSANFGTVYLGKASTDNPSERGQSNNLLLNSVGLNYDFLNGLRIYGMASFASYGRKGLAPLSMPSHNAYTTIDSRVATRGTSIGAGVEFTF
jgi:hypothetical protein